MSLILQCIICIIGKILFLKLIFGLCVSVLDEENSLHVVVNCGEALLKNNTYWPLVSDFINILSHQSVAKRFLEDHGLLVTWMNFVSFFQGMNFTFLLISLVYKMPNAELSNTNYKAINSTLYRLHMKCFILIN